MAQEAASRMEPGDPGLAQALGDFAFAVSGDPWEGVATQGFRFSAAKALQAASLVHFALGRTADRDHLWNALYLAEASHYRYGRPIFAEVWTASPAGAHPRHLSALTAGAALDAAFEEDCFSKSDVSALMEFASLGAAAARAAALESAPRVGRTPGERLDMLESHFPKADASSREARADILAVSRHVCL